MIKYVSILETIPKSKRRFFIKTVRSLPTGDRNMRDHIKPYYEIWRRPVDAHGEKCSWYGTKNEHWGHFDSYDLAAVEREVAFRNSIFHVEEVISSDEA